METTLQMQEKLTAREQTIFDLLLEGFSAKEIASKLYISDHTIGYHRTKIYRKLGVNDINELFKKYGSAQQDDITALNPNLSKSIKHRFWHSINKGQNRIILFLLAGIIIAVSVFLIWHFLFNTSVSSTSKTNNSWVVLSNHAGWVMNIRTGSQESITDSTINYKIEKETIQNWYGDVLTLTVDFVKENSWQTASLIATNSLIKNILREGSGIRFNVLGDAGIGWMITLWTYLEEDVFWEYYLLTMDNQVVEFDIPFTDFNQPAWQKTVPFNLEVVNRLVIQRVAPDSSISGSSTIKIFDFEIY